VEAGKRVVVGVNEYASDEPVPSLPAPDYSALAEAQRARVQAAREQRDAGRMNRALAELEAAARAAAAPLMEPIVAAVRARATLGEISDVLRRVWGEYRPQR
jgi:methylmalonyl-CoA mutase N-terminal domain/subunit